MSKKNPLSEAFESRVLETISEHVIYYNKDFEIKWANKAAADSINLTPLELIGKKCYIIWQNRTSPCENCPVIDALNTGKSKSTEMITPDGRVWLVKGYPVYNNKNEITGAVEITREITDLKEAEKKLRESEEKYRNLVNNILDQIIETELDGTITYVSPQVYDIFGYKPEEIIGRRSIQFVHPDDINIVKEAMEKAVKSGEKISSEYKIKHKNGFYVNVASRGQLIKRGNYYKLIAVIRNVTAQKKADILLKKSEKKFREAYNRANFYKDLFAHDMSNILQNIYSAFQLSLIQLKNGKHLKDIYENTDIIVNQVNRGAKLISNVRKLSELENIDLPLHSIEVLNILNKCIKFVLNTYQYRELNIRIDSQNKKFIVKVNNLLEDVFENILINAIKHNQNSPVDVVIKVSKIQKEGLNLVKFEFKDNGIGIPDANKELIFQRAFNTDKKVGMGIGLSLVKKILDIYNAQIWVEDKVQGDYSKGSNFIVLIPEVNTK